MAVHLNVDLGLTEALGLLKEKKNAEFACVETRLHSAPQVELMAIFEGLAGLKNVRHFFVKKLVNLSARALAVVISKQQDLEFLYLQNIKISGEEEDFAALEKAFRTHLNLRKIRLYMCRPSIRTNETFDSLVSALSKMQTLEEVTIIHSKISTEEEWDGLCLADLCRSKSLKNLTLTFGTELRDEHIESMAEALQRNKTLKSISIRAGNLGTSAGIAMGQVLKTNRTLERLRVQLSSDEHAVPIVEALHKNEQLQRLGLVLPSSINKGVRQQFTLEMTEMLRRSNYNLRDLDLVGWKANIQIQFYLKVNQAGRRCLLAEGASSQQWADTLVSNSDDLSIVYYFLKRNPQLCLAILRQMLSSTAATSETHSATAPKKRRCDEVHGQQKKIAKETR